MHKSQFHQEIEMLCNSFGTTSVDTAKRTATGDRKFKVIRKANKQNKEDKSSKSVKANKPSRKPRKSARAITQTN